MDRHQCNAATSSSSSTASPSRHSTLFLFEEDSESDDHAVGSFIAPDKHEHRDDDEDEDGDGDGNAQDDDSRLTSLTISGPLTTPALGRALGLGRQLTRLQLSYGNLTSLPLALCYAMPALASLSLCNNKLAALPPQIALLSGLTQLDLTRNLLTRLPSRLHEMVELSTLNVEGNQLECFPVELGGMAKLQSPQGRFFFTKNPLLSATEQPAAILIRPFPALVELAARSVLAQRCCSPPTSEASSNASETDTRSLGGAPTSSTTTSTTPTTLSSKHSSVAEAMSTANVDKQQTKEGEARMPADGGVRPTQDTTERGGTTSDRGGQRERWTSGRADIPLSADLERYLDEYARCSVCGQFVWASYVEHLRYRVLRYRFVPLVYRCCSLACINSIFDTYASDFPSLLPPPRSRLLNATAATTAISSEHTHGRGVGEQQGESAQINTY